LFLKIKIIVLYKEILPHNLHGFIGEELKTDY